MTSIFLPLIMAAGLWSNPGERCADVQPQQIAMVCTSGSVLGQVHSGAGQLEADVWLDPAANGVGWASVVINGDVPADNRYASAGLVQDMDPWQGYPPWGVLLSQMPTHTNGYTLVETPAGWHRLRISYDGAGIAEACVDGHCERVLVEMPEWQYQLICTGVPVNTPGVNPATCRFMNIRMH